MVADDRTGALEVAAALADRRAGAANGVPVAVWPHFPDAELCVVDLESRHLEPDEAALRATEVGHVGPTAHKIDSTLRGNWAHELVARHAASARPVLLVPALPALGRTCVDGEVRVDGVPVGDGWHAVDVRAGVASSRPADHLRAAGALDVIERTRHDRVGEWMAAPHGCLVVDAETDEDVAEIVDIWSGSEEVLLAGTSAVIAAVAGGVPRPLDRRLPAPVLVVCGSAHPSARRQIAVLAESGAALGDAACVADALGTGRHAVLASEEPDGSVDAEQAERVATDLGRTARSLAESGAVGALVVLGGDTAAAVLGDATVHVAGSLAPGTAWVESPDVPVPVVTRAGGFGGERALLDLISATLPS